MTFLKKYILLTFFFSFAFTIAKSQDLSNENVIKEDFSFLFQNVEKSTNFNIQAIVIPNSKQSFSGFDAAKAYSYIDKTKTYKNIYFIYSGESNTKMFDKHIPIIKTWLNAETEVIPIFLKLSKNDKKTIEYVKSLLSKNNFLIISEEFEDLILASKSYSEIPVLNKKGSQQSNWKVLFRK